MSSSQRWPGSLVSEALSNVRAVAVPALTESSTKVCELEQSNDLPRCDTGPAGRVAFVFRKIALLWRGRHKGDDRR